MKEKKKGFESFMMFARAAASFISSVFLYFLASGGGLAAINTQADFQHKAVEESWRAWVSVVRNQPNAPKWIQSDNAKFEESIVGYIPKVLADATVGRGRFASDRLRKNEVILLDHGTNAYSGANWNSVMMLNLIAASYLGNFAGNAEKLAYLPDDKGVEDVGNVLQKQLFTKYNMDYSEEIRRAVSDVKIYANKLNLYGFISSMCAIRYRYDKLQIPEGTNAPKLPDLSNYLAPNCWTSHEFDTNTKIGKFTISNAVVFDGSKKITGNITAYVQRDNFDGYKMSDGSFSPVDRDMSIPPVNVYNLPFGDGGLPSPGNKTKIQMHSSEADFYKKRCLSASQIKGMLNFEGQLRNMCWYNSAMQTLHASNGIRRLVSTLSKDVPDLPDNESWYVGKAVQNIFDDIEKGDGKTYERYLQNFKNLLSRLDQCSAMKDMYINIEGVEEELGKTLQKPEAKTFAQYRTDTLTLFKQLKTSYFNNREALEIIERYTKISNEKKVGDQYRELFDGNQHDPCLFIESVLRGLQKECIVRFENSKKLLKNTMFERSVFAWCGCGKGEHCLIDLAVSFWSPSLSDETKSDIRYLFQRLFKTEWGDWDNDELCPNRIHSVDKIAKIEFVKSLPKTLVFRPYGAIANTNIPPRYMYPERLQVQDSEGVKTYLLVAALNHHGATNQGGHFTAKIRLSDGNWLHADDYSVSSTTIHPLTDGNVPQLIYEQL